MGASTNWPPPGTAPTTPPPRRPPPPSGPSSKNRAPIERLPDSLRASLFARLPVGALLVDANGGDILHANDRICAWLGREREAVVGMTWPELLPVGQRLFWANLQVLAANIGGEAPEVSYDLRCADGATFPALVTAEAIEEDVHLYVVYRAERRRRYERQLLEAKRRAEEAARFRQQFVNTVSHEIRTPIHAIVNMADFLAEARLGVDEGEVVTQLRDATDYLLRLVNDVLDLAKAEEGRLVIRPAPVDLRGLCDGLAAALAPAAEAKAIALERAYDLPAEGVFLVDGSKLTQVLTNLLSNAIKFTEAGGVRLEVSAEDLPPEPGAPAPDGDTGRARLHFAVRDTGPGIAAEAAESIFEPFVQAGPKAGASGTTGLGLSISRRIVEAFGGRLTLESAPGHGATFAFSLEARPASTRATSDSPAEAPGDDGVVAEVPGLRGLRILHADDNPTNRFIARRHLRAQALTLDEAKDGAEAVELARVGAYDAILLDIRMPGMSGTEAAREIRRLPGHATTPLYAVSAGSRPPGGADAQPPFDDYLVKPYSARQLVDLVAGRAVARAHADGGADDGHDPRGPSTGFAIGLRELREEFADDPGEYRDFLSIMRADLLASRATLVRAVRQGNREHLSEERHRLQTIIRTLRPRPLAELIAGTRELPEGRARERLADELDAAVLGTVRLVDAELGGG